MATLESSFFNSNWERIVFNIYVDLVDILREDGSSFHEIWDATSLNLFF